MFYKVILNIIIILVTCFVIFYVVQTSKYETNAFQDKYVSKLPPPVNYNLSETFTEVTNIVDHYYNVWCIFTKVKSKNSSLKFKFNTLITSILYHSSVKLSFHIITDPKSQYFSQIVFSNLRNSSTRHIDFTVSHVTMFCISL